MKLNESQAESLELLYCSIVNAITYAEDLQRSGNFQLRGYAHKILLKLRWILDATETGLTQEKKEAARNRDHLFIDELLRCSTHMNDDQKRRLEEFINAM
jgi:hypothetical protein